MIPDKPESPMPPQPQSTPPDPGVWLTLMDYANKNNISLSTLRRYIKAQKVTFKVEEGRYLLWQDPSGKRTLLAPAPKTDSLNEVLRLQSEVDYLTKNLKQAQEEIAELKTLIALYEENISTQRLDN